MSLSRASATKNMWMERGGHIGALVGGIFGKLFGWVPGFTIAILKWIFVDYGWVMFVFIAATVYGFIAMMHGMDHRYEPATTEEISYELSQPHRECLKEYVPRIVKDLKAQSMSYGRLKKAQEECVEAEKQETNLAKQKALLGVDK